MNKRILLLEVSAMFFFLSCGDGLSRHWGGEQTDEALAVSEKHSGEIIISSEKAASAGIVVDEVRPGRFHGVIPVGGKILEASGDERTVVASSAGVVSFARPVAEGAYLPKGSAVFSITAGHIQGGDPLQRAKIAYETAKRNYERARKLVGDTIVSAKEFNAIKSAYEDARIAYEAIPVSPSGGVVVASPISGYVKSCQVKDGDYVSVGQPLLSVTQNRRLYLRADVPERHYGVLGEVSSAVFKPSYADTAFNIKSCHGRLVAMGKSAGNASGYIPVTFEFDNVGGIVPGAFAEVWLTTGPREDVLTLPISAVTEEQGSFFVYVQDDATCYRKQEVNLGQSDGLRVEVTGGLAGGEKVVTKGAMQVKLAAASSVIPAHNHNH